MAAAAAGRWVAAAGAGRVAEAGIGEEERSVEVVGLASPDRTAWAAKMSAGLLARVADRPIVAARCCE